MRALSGLLIVIVATAGHAQTSRRCGFDVGSRVPNMLNPRSLAGSYQVDWHPIRHAELRKVRQERLWLWPSSPSDSSAQQMVVRPAPGATAIDPLFGATLPHSNPTTGDSLHRSTDPIFPPVLFFVGWP